MTVAATLADDDHVIVVTNSQTGEVRQCGDLSGYCITFNPWAGPLDASRVGPVALEPLRDENGRVIERLVPEEEEATVASPARWTRTGRQPHLPAMLRARADPPLAPARWALMFAGYVLHRRI